jgi:hypothetical protein
MRGPMLNRLRREPYFQAPVCQIWPSLAPIWNILMVKKKGNGWVDGVLWGFESFYHGNHHIRACSTMCALSSLSQHAKWPTWNWAHARVALNASYTLELKWCRLNEVAVSGCLLNAKMHILGIFSVEPIWRDPRSREGARFPAILRKVTVQSKSGKPWISRVHFAIRSRWTCHHKHIWANILRNFLRLRVQQWSRSRTKVLSSFRITLKRLYDVQTGVMALSLDLGARV